VSVGARADLPVLDVGDTATRPSDIHELAEED